MNPEAIAAIVTLAVTTLTWFLGLSFALGSIWTRVKSLESLRAEEREVLSQIWHELRRLAEQGDHLAGLHDAEKKNQFRE